MVGNCLSKHEMESEQYGITFIIPLIPQKVLALELGKNLLNKAQKY